LLNLCLQYLIEAGLVICSYYEAVYLGIDVLQELVRGMNLFTNFILYPYLIPNNISERGLISVEILPITTLLAVVEQETGFVPPSIEALIRTKTIVCKDDNEDDVQFLVRVELEAEGIVGSYTKAEHDACLAHVHNRGRLNRVFELAGVSYGSRAVSGTDEFTEAVRKRKLDVAGKNPRKHLKMVEKRKWMP
jgi:hypothetical protein